MSRLLLLQKYNFETGIYRPPSEGGSYSLLIRVTRNCPWNRCEFCMMYKGEKFELRTPEEVKADIDSIEGICNRLKSISHKLGYNGDMNRNVAISLIEETPELNTSHGFVMVYDWLSVGGKTAFLQDANSLILPAQKLVDILKHLRKTFPSLNRVTSYARSRTLAQRKPEELTAIRKAGLDRLHVGLETGDDVLLKKIKKRGYRRRAYQRGQKSHGGRISVIRILDAGVGGKRDVGRSRQKHSPGIKRNKPRLYTVASIFSGARFPSF